MKLAFLTLLLGTAAVVETAAQPPASNKPTDKKLLAVVTSSRADAEAVARANRLTDRMAHQLRLNNYQTSRLRTINRNRAKQMFEIERKAGLNPQQVDEQCQGVCREQERDLRALLSTTQYSDYYESRNDFYAFDKQYMAQQGGADGKPGNGIVLPGNPASPELKTTTTEPTIRQGR